MIAGAGGPLRRFAADGLSLELLGAIDIPPGEILPADPVLAAAVELAACEPLLACLEDWLDEAPDWAPSPAAAAGPHPDAEPEPDLVLRRRDEPMRGIAVRFDAERLARLATAPLAPDAGVEGVFRRVTVDVRLDRIALSASEARALAPGALLLLPAAFGPRWNADLRERGGAATTALEATYDVEGGTLSEWRAPVDDAEVRPTPSGGGAVRAIDVEVYLEEPLRIDAPRWQALRDIASTDGVAAPGTRRVRVVVGARELVGSLAPLGSGRAVYLDAATGAS